MGVIEKALLSENRDRKKALHARIKDLSIEKEGDVVVILEKQKKEIKKEQMYATHCKRIAKIKQIVTGAINAEQVWREVEEYASEERHALSAPEVFSFIIKSVIESHYK